ncbi:ABC transporter ATP-binding protein [Clostridium oryzae]|uniref:Oligopeptide transport ATP-binding protein OppD n=1 Tax=Clostridium oryzae TaxID=1450648 RepID=A0A1V4IEW9_9CLOT|nr:ABC transporter ATP-binding protein [Clostridium oryzae]OPJ58400.1 oligopeptide transport ATP-binding protein OppD [Clostridium oryzae]
MNKNDNSLLEIRHLKTQFFTRSGIVHAVDDVSLTVDKGKVVGLVGESGCGKSVTSLSIMQLVSEPGKVVGGEIVFDGQDLLKLNKKQMNNIRGNDISMIFQEPMTSLNPVYTIGHQLSEAIFTHNKNISKTDAKKRIIDTLNLVGIPEAEKRYNVYPHQLSGGLRQRTMIAISLICNSKLLIADEPTTALDVTIEAQIIRLMKDIQNKLNTSIIMITHNLGVVAEICDDVYVMYAGQVVEHTNVFDLFDNPKHPYTLGLLNSMPNSSLNTINKNEDKKRLYTIKGMVPNMLYPPKGCRFNPRCPDATEQCINTAPDLIDIGNNHCVRCLKYIK